MLINSQLISFSVNLELMSKINSLWNSAWYPTLRYEATFWCFKFASSEIVQGFGIIWF
jgi:hypothetical protein